MVAEVTDLDRDDLMAAAAYMRELNGPAAEPIAQIFGTYAEVSFVDLDDLHSSILTAARAVAGRPPRTPSPATESQ